MRCRWPSTTLPATVKVPRRTDDTSEENCVVARDTWNVDAVKLAASTAVLRVPATL
jgi:hypothetical protein